MSDRDIFSPIEDAAKEAFAVAQEEDTTSPWAGIPHKAVGFIKDGTTMQVYISADMAHRLKKAAAKVGVSRSEFVRVASRTFMEEHGLWSLRGPQAGKETNNEHTE